jgi:hypothetical protein
MSIMEAIAFQQLRQQVDMLVEEQAAQAARLAALEAGECATCAQRRAGDAVRQRRSRQRHVADATEPALEPVASADCSPGMP